MAPQFIERTALRRIVRDGSTVATDGFCMMAVPEGLLQEIELSFLETGSPRDLTLLHAAGPSDGEHGIEHFAHAGLVRRVIGAHWGFVPRLSELLSGSDVESICLPQGQLAELYRAMAGGRPGVLTKVGLDTFVDPRRDGGRMNEAAQALPADTYVELVRVGDAEHLLIKAFQVDVALIRATVVDEDGNATQSEEAIQMEALAMAQAVRNMGGVVVCQAKAVVPRGTLAPKEVVVPGRLIDYVYVAEDPVTEHRQVHGAVFDPRLVCAPTMVDELDEVDSSVSVGRPMGDHPSPEVERARTYRTIGDLALRLLRPGDLANVGAGIPIEAIPAAIDRARRTGDPTVPRDVLFTVESGIYGGRPAVGLDVGSAMGAQAIIPHAAQLGFYGGGGLDISFLGAGQIDAAGNVNVSRLGRRVIGVGGFLDIVAGARRLAFCFTTGGRHAKFVPALDHVSFSADRARELGQEVHYVCEEAVLRLGGEGLTLTSLSAQVDVAELLDRLPFEVAVEESLDRF